MKKQIIFPGFITRLFAATIDITFFSLITMPITNLIGHKLFAWSFADYFNKNQVDINDLSSVSQFFTNFDKFGAEEWALLNSYIIITLINNFIIMGICYLGCWFKWGNTLGKALLQLKIVDKESMLPINKTQYLKRYLGYSLTLLNLFIMPFDKRTRGIQDMVAGTVVIKR
jgi:hypothetical protein